MCMRSCANCFHKFNGACAGDPKPCNLYRRCKFDYQSFALNMLCLVGFVVMVVVSVLIIVSVAAK